MAWRTSLACPPPPTSTRDIHPDQGLTASLNPIYANIYDARHNPEEFGEPVAN
jgi:hypothetical protein